MSSIFTKIIKGELPCYKIHEDEYTFAFLDIRPINIGHTLIVPKVEVDYFIDVEEPCYSAVFRNAKPIAKAIHKATDCERVGTAILGFEVPHFHYHLVPMWNLSDLDFKKASERSKTELEAIHKKILTYLKI